MYKASRMAHAFIAVMSVKQTIAYTPFLKPVYDGPAAAMLTEHGEYLWIYSALWAISSLAALWGIIRPPKAQWPLHLFIFLCLCWAGGYAAAWAVSGFRSDDFMSACTYVTVAGAYMTIYRLLDILNERAYEHVTETISVVGGGK